MALSAPAATVGAVAGNLVVFVKTDVGAMYTIDVLPHAPLAGRRSTVGGASPRWSPDGRRLGFSSAVGIVVAPLSRAGKVVTPDSVSRVRGFSWAPDGARIVYAAAVRGGRRSCTDIFVTTIDGRTRAQLTRTPACEFAPEWSPDGTRIAFGRSVVVDGHPGTRILVTSASGGRETEIALVRGSGAPARWTPDGRNVAFAVETGLRLVDPGTGARRDLLPSLGAIESFSFAPDGSKLVFSRRELTDLNGKIGSRLSIADVETAAVRVLTVGDSDLDPDWQPRCTLYGTAGPDELRGTPADDVICALGGADRIDGRGGNDVILGGDGSDRIEGGAGKDWLFGGGGADTVSSLDGEMDTVAGGPGEDELRRDPIDVVG